MAEILLTSERFVKEVLAISDNITGKFLLPAMREAQEVDLRTIWGDKLLDAVKAKVADGSITDPQNVAYKALLDLPYTQYYLAYVTGVKVQPKVAFKVGNLGVVKSTDEHTQSVTMEELTFSRNEYQNNADSNCRLMQVWMREHRSDLPEASCGELHDFAECNVYLGGARGKRIIRK